MNTIGRLVDYKYIDWFKLRSLLRKELVDVPDESLQVKKFSEGYSNITYLISIGNWEAVLRRPPFGNIPSKAHDMKREFTILSKVNRVFPLAPKPLLYKEDTEIMSRHFYVMEKKQGVVLDDTIPKSIGESKKVGPIISNSMIHALNQLQSINIVEANLTDIGKPEGYLDRQVNGWIKRYHQSKTEQIINTSDLEDWFRKNIPTSPNPTIVHNDFKLNNVLLDEQNPRNINGVLDWELSTIGDPLTDLGSTVAYWGESGDPYLGINIVTNQPGFYSRRQFVEEYARLSGRDLSNIHYYVALGFYKLAVILQQIYYRWKNGELNDSRFEHLNISIKNLFEMADLARTKQLL
ncbi:phosphotransferase family protein [Salirhabdus sp. Marseille-P4669]|uniref:phosphotransferase family protein n=1 Tax=Salirhabdus sp. Marseille-P4669 TaxID=2042310 RepID=UPI000C7BA7EB|nr:phosphotransferase family protein [Salirhabdus sp. Marseille-P4669]